MLNQSLEQAELDLKLRDEISWFLLLVIIEFGLIQTDVLGGVVFLIILIVYYLCRFCKLVYEQFFKNLE